MKKILAFTILVSLVGCGPSQEELNEQKRLAQEKEIQDFKSSKQYQEYLKDKLENTQISQEIKDAAEELIILDKNSFYKEEIVDPKEKQVTLYKFDGCEYLGYNLDVSSSQYLTHRGRCKFCHKRDSLMIVSIIKSIVPNIVEKYGNYR